MAIAVPARVAPAPHTAKLAPNQQRERDRARKEEESGLQPLPCVTPTHTPERAREVLATDARPSSPVDAQFGQRETEAAQGKRERVREEGRRGSRRHLHGSPDAGNSVAGRDGRDKVSGTVKRGRIEPASSHPDQTLKGAFSLDSRWVSSSS